MSNTVYNYRVFCTTENTNVYCWAPIKPVVCPHNNSHTIDSSSIVIVDSISQDPLSVVSESNSTTLNLASGNTFTGEFESMNKYSSVSVLIVLNENEYGTLQTEFAVDNNGTAKNIKSYKIGKGGTINQTFSVISEYFRIVVNADLGTSLTGRIQIIYHKSNNTNAMVSINEEINNNVTCQLSRTIISGSNVGGQFNNVGISPVGPDIYGLRLALPYASFGELMTVTPTPIVQIYAPYNFVDKQKVMTQIYDSNATNGSTVTVEDGVYNVISSTGGGSSSILTSKKLAVYRPGQGLTVRQTGIFPKGGIQNTYQVLGFGTHFYGIFIGYKNTDFGIIYRNGGKSTYLDIEFTHDATSTGTITIVLNSVSFEFNVTEGDTAEYIAYKIALSNEFFLKNSNGKILWRVQNINNKIIILGLEPGPRTGTYSFNGASTGVTASVGSVTQGVMFTEEFIPQSSFNVDKLDGTGVSGFNIDPTKGNVYQMQLQWLGFGAMSFYVEDDSGNFTMFHKILYTNRHTKPSMLIPHGYIVWAALVLPGQTASEKPQVQGPCGYAGVDGKIYRSRPKYALSHTEQIYTDEKNILALKGRVRMREHTNLVECYLTSVCLSVSGGTGNVIFRFYTDPQLSPTPSNNDYPKFEEVHSDSMILCDKNSLTHSGGINVLQYIVCSDSSITINERDLNGLYINRETILCITAEGNGNDASISLCWVEDQ